MPKFRFRTNAARKNDIPGYQGPSYHERQVVDRPVRKPGFVSDFIVPLFSAAAGSTLLACFLVLLYSFIWSEPERGWLPLLGVIWLPATFILYVITQTAAWSLLWSWAEIVTRKDLDKSGSIGDRPIVYGNRGGGRPDLPKVTGIDSKESAEPAPSPEAPLETVEHWTPELIVAYFPIKANETTLHWFVRVAEQIGTGSRIWEPVLGRKRTRAFRDSLIRAEWAKWKSFSANGAPIANAGWELVGTVEEICSSIKA